MPITTVTSKGQVTIPKEVREQLHLQAGDKIDFFTKENGGNLNLLHNQGGRPLSILLKVDNYKCLKLFDYRA